MGQGGSHTLGFDVAEQSPVAYAWQLVTGTAYLMSPTRFRISIALLVTTCCFLLVALGPARSRLKLADARTSGVLRTYLVFAAVTAILTRAQFSTTWIDEPLNGRFLLFLPLVLVPASMVLLARSRRPWLAVAMCVGLALQPLVRLVEQTGRPIDAYPYMVLPGDSIHPRFVQRLPVTREGRRVISPPLYPWTELALRGVDQRSESQPEGGKPSL
jgi:hypothetical protein